MSEGNSKRTFESVWEDLSMVDCSDHVSEKMGLSYLAWAWAHGIMMTKYPDHYVHWVDGPGYTDGVCYHPDGSATVKCEVGIPDHSGEGTTLIRHMWLPVMDHKNKAITNPDARQISDAKMRCFVKGYAILGLGHYIYAGEDLPNDPERERKIESAIQAVRAEGHRLKQVTGAMPPKVADAAKKAIMGRDHEELSSLLKSIRADIKKAEKGKSSQQDTDVSGGSADG